VPGQLRCKNLQPGGHYVKVNEGSLVARLIRAGQASSERRIPTSLMPGSCLTRTLIIEAQGNGIVANNGDLGYNYYVYRCSNANMARGAGTCVKMMFDIHAQTGSLKYSLLGAIRFIFGSRGAPLTPGDMDRLLTRLALGQRALRAIAAHERGARPLGAAGADRPFAAPAPVGPAGRACRSASSRVDAS
jgi:hypothetical protein